jgi:hypothetical protein
MAGQLDSVRRTWPATAAEWMRAFTGLLERPAQILA